MMIKRGGRPKCRSSMSTTTERKFHNISIEDREMFAYNAAYQRKQQQLAKVTP